MGFQAESRNVLRTSVLYLLRCSFFSLHLLSVMLFVVFYLLPNFWFYRFDLECILIFLFGMSKFSLGFLKFLCIGICCLFCFLIDDDIFILSHFSLIAIAFQGTLHLALGLVGTYSTAAFIWTITNFSYLSFGVCHSNVSWRVSTLFLTVIVKWFLISLLSIEDKSCCEALNMYFLFLRRFRRIFVETIL